MNKFNKTVLFGMSFAMLMCADFNPQTTLKIGFMPEASAIVGRPLTPVSYAGVARRTTYRAVGASEAAAAETNAAAQANANSAAGVLDVGTIVHTLPTGCDTTKGVNNSTYYDCGGVYYKAGYQSGNLVYVVSAP